MNERLLELAHQAKIEFTYDPTETPMRAFAECWEDELEKFAELIVKECVQVVDDMANPEDSERYFWAIQNASQKIREHFGVEE